MNDTDANTMNEIADAWKIIYVADKPPIPPNHQPTVEVFASVIEPKYAHAIVRRLNQIVPLENFRHVKRVKKEFLTGGTAQLSVILCLASETDGHLETMTPDLQELINSYGLNPFTTKVCKYVALSKEEWEEQCKLWPTSYHPITYNIEGITGFGDEDSRSIFSYMKSAVKLAKSCDGQVVNAAVIVDPSVKQVIATAHDQTSSWFTPPEETSCIDQSEAFGSGLHSNGIPTNGTSSSINDPTQSYTHVSCLYPWRWAGQQLHTKGTCYWNPLRHAPIVAIETAAARDRKLFPGLEQNGNMQSMAGYPTKRQKTKLTEVNNDEELVNYAEDSYSASARPYLCTGYDIFLVWEPCAMCAMALVHQRVRRIFYAFLNPNAGALGSVHRLQGEKSLNHHYAVFRVLLPENILGD